MKADTMLYLAVCIAVFTPSLPFIGNPENIAALIMLICVIRYGSPSIINKLFISFIILALLFSLSTLVGILIINGKVQFNINSIGVYFRMIICYFAIKSATNISIMHGRFLLIGAATSIFGILQFFSAEITDFTIKYYVSPDRAAVFDYENINNEIVRVVSFFENPSSVGLLAVVLILFGINEFSSGRMSKSMLVLFVIINMMAGIFSLSKIFFVGLFLIFFRLFKLDKRYIIYTSLTVFALILLLVFTLEIKSPVVDLVLYSLSASINPEVALEGRYLNQQVGTLLASKYFGYGVMVVDNVNINDSLYMGIIYSVGMFGAFIIFGVLLAWLIINKNFIELSSGLALIIIAIAGVGTNSIMGFRLDLFLTAIIVTSIYSSKLRMNS